MWPLHRFERRYNAALTIITAAYTFSVLTPSEQARVDDKVYANLGGALIGFSKFEFQRLFPPPLKAAWRACAMAALEIPPAIGVKRWAIPRSRRWWGLLPSWGAIQLFNKFRAGDDATKQAQRYLEAKGIKVQGLI
jgi:hypothetical protein